MSIFRKTFLDCALFRGTVSFLEGLCFIIFRGTVSFLEGLYLVISFLEGLSPFQRGCVINDCLCCDPQGPRLWSACTV